MTGHLNKEALWSAIRWAGALLLVVIAILLLFEEITPSVAGAIAAALAGAALISVLTPQTIQALLDRTQSLTLGPFALDLVKDAAAAAAEAGSTEGAAEDFEADMVGLQLKLEWKLAFIVKHLLPPETGPRYATIGSLKFDGYLSESEARTATRIMTITDEQLATLPKSAREDFLGSANRLVDNIRASVFAGMVRKKLRKVAGKDSINEVIWKEGRRPDFLVRHNGGERRVVAIFAPFDEGKGSLKYAIGRLRGEEDEPMDNPPIVVIPDISNSPSDLNGNPRVVPLSELAAVLSS